MLQKKEGRPPAEEMMHGDGLPLVWWKAKAIGACCGTTVSFAAAE
jgi:hypothetical protein